MFDAVLDRGTAPQARFGTGAAISVVLHLAALGFTVWFSTRPTVQRNADSAVIFMAGPLARPLPPPPPPPPPASQASVKAHHKPVTKAEKVLQPREIPTQRPAEAEPAPTHESEDESVTGGVEGGVKGGATGGTLGGTVGGAVGGALGGQSGGQLRSEVLPFGEGMTRPARIQGQDPVYTREALEAHVEGLIIVKCIITVEGRPENCRMIKPLPHMEKAVLDALASQRFRPVTFQGRPVSVDYVFNIRLVLPKH